MDDVKNNTKEILSKVTEELSKVRQENNSVKQLDAVMNADNPNEVTPIEPQAEINPEITQKSFQEVINSFGLDEVSALMKVSDAMNKNEDYDVYRNLPPITKRYIDACLDEDKINKKDTKIVNDIARIKVNDIVSNLKIDEAFKEFKENINEAFQGRDCFEELFIEDKTRILEYYEQLAKTYDTIANDIKNPTEQNTITYKECINDDIIVKLDSINTECKWEDKHVYTVIPEITVATPGAIDVSEEDKIKEDYIVKFPKQYINIQASVNPELYEKKAEELRDCAQGYKDALDFNLLFDYLKTHPTDTSRLFTGKYLKRFSRFGTEYESYIKRSGLKPINFSLVSFAKAFGVTEEDVMYLIITLVLKLREYKEGPRKVHYAYYSVQFLKRFYCMNINNITNEYVKDLVSKFKIVFTNIRTLIEESHNI